MRALDKWMVQFGKALAGLLLASTAWSAPHAAYGLGQEAIADYRYGEALAHFRQAAEHGDRDAQRILGLMLLYGESLYGQEVLRDPLQARRWLGDAARNGCEVSEFLLRTWRQAEHVRPSGQ